MGRSWAISYGIEVFCMGAQLIECFLLVLLAFTLRPPTSFHCSRTFVSLQPSNFPLNVQEIEYPCQVSNMIITSERLSASLFESQHDLLALSVALHLPNSLMLLVDPPESGSERFLHPSALSSALGNFTPCASSQESAYILTFQEQDSLFPSPKRVYR